MSMTDDINEAYSTPSHKAPFAVAPLLSVVFYRYSLGRKLAPHYPKYGCKPFVIHTGRYRADIEGGVERFQDPYALLLGYT
ncbi:hypothetical protein K443DRAFT_237208 [Laccaria amethystina LaAM-08-1]|uniref:Uncharacterized protein n=1 Tax=Laccaria amethystina LaAM-08-1 TaxID=1095629 RepID=A0A0C9WM25_9AGAR|nr:hypothetical protein K443DRAFT_237208 [Laccaria amethystina LaAM-08-1]